MKMKASAAAATIFATFCSVVLHEPRVAAAAEIGDDLVFVPVKLDGPIHDPARHSYWFGPFAECATVLDINKDGKLDIAAGRNYYLAPDFKKRADYRDGAETNGPDVDDNYEGTMDVNGDGFPDVISSGWMRRQGVWWYENPAGRGSQWVSHKLHEANGVEGMVIGNLAGRGEKDILVNYFAKKPGRGLVWFEHLDQAPWFREHKLGGENLGVSHGGGIGDINGDGRMDVVTPEGWFESPTAPTSGEWFWHPDYQFSAFGDAGRPSGTGLPILVADVDEDGLNDIIMASDHRYGLAWYRQTINNGKRTFEPRWIDTGHSTFHTMAMADLDGDGKPELITGKQLFGHNGEDAGSFEPAVIFYYKINKGRFERHVISHSHVAPYFDGASNATPPPLGVIGLGMRFQVADIDGDQRPDIVVASKTGLYVFYNKGYPIRTLRTSRLPQRSSYPSHHEWDPPRPPRASEADSDGFVSLFNGRDFTGWNKPTNWVVEDGVITLKDRTDRQEHNDNYLWAQRPYEDFILDLEFKVIATTNSGVYLRTSDTMDPVQTGIEVQVANLLPTQALKKGSLGGMYDIAAPRVNALKPGEWNRYTITCDGPKITIVLNGQLVSEVNLDLWPQARKNPDGTANKFDRPLKEFARSGFIGLQDHGSPVWYRNIRIKVLEKNR